MLDSYPFNYPHAPDNIQAIPGPSYIDLSWEPTTYDGGSPVIAVYIYDVGWNDDATPLAKLGPEVRSYRIGGLNPGQSYVFYMRSENANGMGWWSSSNWATVGRTTPGVPSSFHLSAGQAQANLSWGLPLLVGGLDVLGYRIYGGTNYTNLTYISTVYESTRNFIATGLQLEVAYYFQVSAFNFFGEGGRSEVLSVRSGYAPHNCVVSPNDFNDCEPHDVTITWSHPSENYSHVVAYRIYSGLYWSPFIPLDNTTVDRTNTTVAVTDDGGWGGNYYAVAAVYDNGDEVFSNAVWVDHPICEGYGGTELLGGSIAILFAIAFLIAFIVLRGKKGKDKR